MSKVAIVTGSNKGIGFEIVKALCKQFDGVVYLAARNVELGNAAVAELNKEGLKPIFHQLDIESVDSIKAFAKHIKEKHGGIDILVNNAAIAFRNDDPSPFHIQAEVTNRINYFATINVCNALFPLLRSHARVVNMSSRGGVLKIIKSAEIRNKLIDQNTTVDDVSQILQKFLDATKENKHQELGFPNSGYGMSKVAVTAATFAQQRSFDKDSTRQDIVVNACCPGWVKTDISAHSGDLTPDQGAATPVYLALLPPNVSEPRGKFVYEKKVFDWAAL